MRWPSSSGPPGPLRGGRPSPHGRGVRHDHARRRRRGAGAHPAQRLAAQAGTTLTPDTSAASRGDATRSEVTTSSPRRSGARHDDGIDCILCAGRGEQLTRSPSEVIVHRIDPHVLERPRQVRLTRRSPHLGDHREQERRARSVDGPARGAGPTATIIALELDERSCVEGDRAPTQGHADRRARRVPVDPMMLSGRSDEAIARSAAAISASVNAAGALAATRQRLDPGPAGPIGLGRPGPATPRRLRPPSRRPRQPRRAAARPSMRSTCGRPWSRPTPVGRSLLPRVGRQRPRTLDAVSPSSSTRSGIVAVGRQVEGEAVDAEREDGGELLADLVGVAPARSGPGTASRWRRPCVARSMPRSRRGSRSRSA